MDGEAFWFLIFAIMLVRDNPPIFSNEELEKFYKSLANTNVNTHSDNPHALICEANTRRFLELIANPDTEGDRVRALCEQSGGMDFEQDMSRKVMVCKRDGQYCNLQCIRKVNYPPCFGC